MIGATVRALFALLPPLAQGPWDPATKASRMRNLVTAPLRAGRHMAIWLLWQSTGVTLIPPQSRR